MSEAIASITTSNDYLDGVYYKKRAAIPVPNREADRIRFPRLVDSERPRRGKNSIISQNLGFSCNASSSPVGRAGS